MRGLPLVAASGGHSSSRCAGLSLSRPLLMQSTGSRRAGSVIVAHGPSCSVACGIFPDQGSNPSPPHWQADSQPLRHQGSPICSFFIFYFLSESLSFHLFKDCSCFFLEHNYNSCFKGLSTNSNICVTWSWCLLFGIPSCKILRWFCYFF